MDLEPSEELELDLQSTKPETKRRRNNEKGMREMRQIHNKLNEHVRHLEDLYCEGIDKGERNDQGTAESSPKVGPLISSLSTCQSAASDLDININAEHQILESLYQRYFKEMQLLEQLTEEDLTLRDVSPAFPAILNEHTGKLTHAFHKLDILKTHLHSLLETVAQGSPPGKNVVAEPIKMDNRYVMPKFPQVSKDKSHEAQNMVKEMHGILTKKDPDSINELEKILDKVENNINVQASEYKKLEREHEDTKNKYARMKSEYQALLEEKIIIENELRSIVKFKRGPPSAGSSLLSNDQIQRPQKIQEERSSSKIHDGWNQEQGAKNETLASKDMVNLQDEASPTQDEAKELTPEKDNIGRKKKQKAKLAKGRERRSSTTSRKTHPVTLADNTSQPKPLPAISEIKPADGSNKEDAAQDEPREKREKRRKYSETENSKSKSYVTREEQQITSDVMDKPASGQRSRRQSVSNRQKLALSPITAQRTSGEEGRDTREKAQVVNSSTEKQIKRDHVVVQSLSVTSTLTPEADRIVSPDSDTQQKAEKNQDGCCSDSAQQNTTTISQSSDRLSEQPEIIHIGPAEETRKSNLASETLLDSSVGTLNFHNKSVPIPKNMRETNSQLHREGNIDHQPIPSGDSWITKLANEPLITKHEPGEINEINTKRQISSDGESRQAIVEENSILHSSPITISKAKTPGTSSITELISQQQATKSSTNMFSTQTLAPPDVKTEAFTKPPGDWTHQNTSPEDTQMAQVADKAEMAGSQPFEKGSPQCLLMKDESEILKDSQKTPSSTPEICKAVPQQFPPEFQKAQLSTTSTTRPETLEAPLLRELSSHQRFWKKNDHWVSLPEDTKKREGSPTSRARPTPAQTEIKLKDVYRYEEDQTSAFWKHQKALKHMAPDTTPQSLVPPNTKDGGFKHLLLGKSEIQDDLSKQADTIQSSGTITMNLPAASKVRNTSNNIPPGDPMERHFSTTAIKTTIFPPLRNRDTPFSFSRDGEILMDYWRPQMSCPTFTKIPESIFRGSEKKTCFSAICSFRHHMLPSYQDIQTEYSTGHVYSRSHEGDKRNQLFLSHPGESISSKSFRLTQWQIDCDHLLYDSSFLRSYNNLLYIQGRHIPLTQRPTGIKNPGSGITAEIYPYLLTGAHIPPMPQRTGTKNRGSRTAKMYPSLPYSIPDLGTFYRTVPLVQWDHPVFSTLKPPHKNQGTQGAKFMKRAS